MNASEAFAKSNAEETFEDRVAADLRIMVDEHIDAACVKRPCEYAVSIALPNISNKGVCYTRAITDKLIAMLVADGFVVSTSQNTLEISWRAQRASGNSVNSENRKKPNPSFSRAQPAPAYFTYVGRCSSCSLRVETSRAADLETKREFPLLGKKRVGITCPTCRVFVPVTPNTNAPACSCGRIGGGSHSDMPDIHANCPRPEPYTGGIRIR